MKHGGGALANTAQTEVDAACDNQHLKPASMLEK